MDRIKQKAEGNEKSVDRISSDKKGWLVLAVFLLLFIGLSYMVNVSQPEEYPRYAAYSPAPAGVKGFYTFLQEEADTVETWSALPEQLPDSDRDTLLVMVEPAFLPEKQEMDAYLSFMEAGNTILLLKHDPEGMFGLETVPGEAVMEETIPVAGKAGNTYQAVVNSSVRIKSAPSDEILLEGDAGVLALKRQVGDGELITAVTPGWATNEMILEQDHIPLILYLLEEGGSLGTVFFDEYTHGGENGPALTALYPKWLIVFTIQAVILAVIWLWNQGKRFGPVVIPREETVRFSDERIQALAAWYQRGRRYSESLAIQADYLKFLLQERWGIPYNREWNEVTDYVTQRSKQLPEVELPVFTSGLIRVLEKEKLDKQEYLVWSKKIEQVRKEVERG